MRSLLRFLKHFPLAAAVTLTTHPALAFNLGNSRLSGGNKEFFEPVVTVLKNITDGLVYIGGFILSLCFVFLIYQVLWGGRLDMNRVGLFILCGAGMLVVGYLPSLFEGG